MRHHFNFKAIFVGLLTHTFASILLGGIVGFVNVKMALNFVAALHANAAQMGQIMQNAHNAPLYLLAVLSAIVVAALLGGYVTGVFAPNAETQNAAAVFAIFFALAFAFTPLGKVPQAHLAPYSVPSWIALPAWLLMLPAMLGGAALRHRRVYDAPHLETFG